MSESINKQKEAKTRREIYESKGPNSKTAKLKLCESLHIYTITALILECAHNLSYEETNPKKSNDQQQNIFSSSNNNIFLPSYSSSKNDFNEMRL